VVRDAAFTIRSAEPADIPNLMAMKRELAAADDALAAICATPTDWMRDLFGPLPRFTAFVATHNGANVGMATCSEHYFTGWVGPTIFLQDLFVRVGHRRQGIGGALLARVGAHARDRGSPMIELTMRDANPADQFYLRNGFEKVCAVYVAGAHALSLSVRDLARQPASVGLPG
jgi:GNAT superfamily N-acetyltransferase